MAIAAIILALLFFGSWLGLANLISSKQGQKQSMILTAGGSFIGAVLIFALAGGAWMFAAGAFKTNESTPAAQSSSVNHDCNLVIGYLKKQGLQLIDDSTIGSGMLYSAKITINGPGITSANPVNVMCSEAGQITIWGGDIVVDKTKATEALKALAPVFLLNTEALRASDAQRLFFLEAGSKLPVDGEWKDQVEGNYVLRIMKVQSDATGNYSLTIQAGNKASQKD